MCEIQKSVGENINPGEMCWGHVTPYIHLTNQTQAHSFHECCCESLSR